MLSTLRLQVKYMLSLSSFVYQTLKGWGKQRTWEAAQPVHALTTADLGLKPGREDSAAPTQAGPREAALRDRERADGFTWTGLQHRRRRASKEAARREDKAGTLKIEAVTVKM